MAYASSHLVEAYEHQITPVITHEIINTRVNIFVITQDNKSYTLHSKVLDEFEVI
jgi:hypothetical protein